MSERAPRVSVVMPAYNHEAFVEDAIRSVLSQSLQDFEILVTDDASSDGTAEVVHRIDDVRIDLVVHDTNRGASAAMNSGIRRASGEFIAILNSDDRFVPEKLARQVSFLQARPEIAAVFAYPRLIDERGADYEGPQRDHFSPFFVKNRSRAEWLWHFFYRGNCLCHPSVLIRRACYNEVGLYDERLAQLPDFDMWVRVCCQHPIHVLEEALVEFRVLGDMTNASAPRPEVRIRDAWERQAVYRHYLSLPRELALEVFADEAGRLALSPNASVPAVIVQAAVLAGGSPHQKFALDILFEELARIPRSKGIPEATEFVRLTGASDVFAIIEQERARAAIGSLNQAVVERDGQIASLNQAVVERDGQIHSLNEAVVERDGQIHSLNEAVVERDGQIHSLNQAVVDGDGQIASLNQAVVERDGQIHSLNEAVVERDGQIASLNQAVADRDGQIASLNQALVDRDGQIARLNQALVDRDGQIARLNHAVVQRDAMLKSTSWRLTAPLRALKRMISRH